MNMHDRFCVVVENRGFREFLVSRRCPNCVKNGCIHGGPPYTGPGRGTAVGSWRAKQSVTVVNRRTRRLKAPLKLDCVRLSGCQKVRSTCYANAYRYSTNDPTAPSIPATFGFVESIT